MKIINWQMTIDPHQFYTFEEMGLLGASVRYIVQKCEHPVRKKQGWKAMSFDNRKMVLLQKKSWLRQGVRIIDENPEAINVFYGFWGKLRFLPLIIYALFRKRKVAIINEPYSLSFTGYHKEEPFIFAWAKVKIRPILYRITAEMLNATSKGSHPCILPISLIAKEQFLRAGFRENSIFPFAYFVPKQRVRLLVKERDKFQLIFVGVLIKRKGLDVLIEAVNKLNLRGVKISLDVYGTGNADNFISSSSGSVRYKGILAREDVQSVMAQYDALVLPSRHDGWGLVVNEALLQGVPVIVSDSVGAKCILESTGAGMVFNNEDVDNLVQILEELSLYPNSYCELRKKAIQIENQISPKTGAAYLMKVFDFYFYKKGERPTAIWSDPISLLV